MINLRLISAAIFAVSISLPAYGSLVAPELDEGDVAGWGSPRADEVQLADSEWEEFFAAVAELNNAIDEELGGEVGSQNGLIQTDAADAGYSNPLEILAELKSITLMIDNVRAEEAARDRLTELLGWYKRVQQADENVPDDRVFYSPEFFNSGDNKMGCYFYHKKAFSRFADNKVISKYGKESHNLYHLSQKLGLDIVHIDPITKAPSVKNVQHVYFRHILFMEEFEDEIAVLVRWYFVSSKARYLISFFNKDTGEDLRGHELPEEIVSVTSMSRFGRDHLVLVTQESEFDKKQFVIDTRSMKKPEQGKVIHDLSFSNGYRIATDFRDNVTTTSVSYEGGEAALLWGDGRILSKPRMARDILFYQPNRNTFCAIDLILYKKLYEVSVSNHAKIIPLIMTDGNEPNVLLRLGNAFRHVEYDYDSGEVKESELLLIDGSDHFVFSFDAKRKRLWAISELYLGPIGTKNYEVICWDMISTCELIRASLQPDDSSLPWEAIKIFGFSEDGSPIIGVEGATKYFK